MQAIVHSLFVYPVKACQGVAVDRLCFDNNGRVQHDREWAVVDANQEVVWQGPYPKLAWVQPAFEDGELVLRALGHSHTTARVRLAGQPCYVSMYNESTALHDSFTGFDGGELAAQFLMAVVGAPLRLVRLGVDARQRDGVNPVHVVSTSSIAEVNAALQLEGHQTVSFNRFRPNIVLTGDPEPLLPFIEEYVTAVHWQGPRQDGSLIDFRPCIRCVVMNVDAGLGVLSHGTLETLAQLSGQRHPGQATCFGVYANAVGPAELALGTIVECALTL